MKAQARHSVSRIIPKLALTAALIVAGGAVAGFSGCPFLTNRPAQEPSQPGGYGSAPVDRMEERAPVAEPDWQVDAGEGPLFEATPRPSGVPEGSFGQPDVGTASPDDMGEGPLSESGPPPVGIPEGDFGAPDVGSPLPDSYDCGRTGIHLAQVNLASIKAFMDDAYRAFVQNETSGDRALAQEKYNAYVTAKTDLDLKRWRCFNCSGEIGCY